LIAFFALRFAVTHFVMLAMRHAAAVYAHTADASCRRRCRCFAARLFAMFRHMISLFLSFTMPDYAIIFLRFR